MDNQNISPLLAQMFLTQAGMFCSERLSVDMVYLNKCIDILLPTFDKSEISYEYEKKFGKDSWKQIMIKKRNLAERLAESKTFYDAIENKTLNKKSLSDKGIGEFIQKTFRKFFYKTSSEIFLMQMDIYNLFVFLVMNSQIQRSTIRTEYFKNLEQRDNRKIKIENKPDENRR